MDEFAPIFLHRTLGLVTSRDAWCYSSSQCQLRDNIVRALAFYNGQVKTFHDTTSPSGSAAQRIAQAKKFAANDPKRFHWDVKNYSDLANGEFYSLSDNGIRVSSYRPFFKQHLYFDRRLNNRIRSFAEIYPDSSTGNLGICITGLGSNSPFHTLMTDNIVEYCLTGVNSIYFPRYLWRESEQILAQSTGTFTPPLERISNINPQALTEFRTHYCDPSISENDLFYYVYAVIHSTRYREIFANDLTKSQARIPMVSPVSTFYTFAQAGMDLADLHVNYERVAPFLLREIYSPRWNPKSQDAFRVTKMRYAGSTRDPDKSRIIYNADITLVGIPDEAHRYVLGSRSALDWLIEHYRVKTHNKSGIVNDPNDWAAEVGDPRYVLDLVKRVTTVSVRTIEIVESLPELAL